MFCPNCGTNTSKNLKFCKNCGERLTKAEIDTDGTPGKMLNKILTALFLIVMFAMGILVGLVAVLLGHEVKTEVVVMITLGYLAAIFGICVTLVRQVPKLIDARLKGWGDSTGTFEPQQLNPPITAQLNEYRQPVMSVTDHTTRTLDELPLKRN